MAWTLKLSTIDHDLVIQNGTFARINGADEVRQRVKVSMWHYRGEYFLNIPHGVPWSSLLGAKNAASDLSNVIRKAILEVPGVLQIASFTLNWIGRVYTVTTQIYVQSGPGDRTGTPVLLDGVQVGSGS